MKQYLILFLLIFTSYFLQAQGGAQIVGGFTIASNLNPDITKAGQYHSGFTIGIQSRLKDNNFVAGPGLKYTRITMMSYDDTQFFSNSLSYHFITMPFNIGLEYRLAYAWKLRMYVGPDVTFFYKIDENKGSEAANIHGLDEINYDFVNDYFFGAHAGLGVDFYWLTFDINFEKGITNAHKLEDSKYNFFNATIGFFF